MTSKNCNYVSTTYYLFELFLVILCLELLEMNSHNPTCIKYQSRMYSCPDS